MSGNAYQWTFCKFLLFPNTAYMGSGIVGHDRREKLTLKNVDEERMHAIVMKIDHNT